MMSVRPFVAEFRLTLSFQIPRQRIDKPELFVLGLRSYSLLEGRGQGRDCFRFPTMRWDRGLQTRSFLSRAGIVVSRPDPLSSSICNLKSAILQIDPPNRIRNCTKSLAETEPSPSK